MSRRVDRVSRAVIITAALANLLWASITVAQQVSEATLVARLAVVEPAAARIAVLVEGEVTLRDLQVAADAEISQGDRKLTLAELVIEVGRRVTVRYRLQQERPVAHAISVEESE